jgi:hypothetical protein
MEPTSNDPNCLQAVKLIYILSLPRSGSSVLSAMMDQMRGVVSVPESAFPQVLGMIKTKERANKRWLAALYLGATMSPTPLSIDDAEECMTGTNHEILVQIGMAVARKMGREESEIKAVVWKTPKVTAALRGPLSTHGRFVVLRRNPHNVFESQFRFHFGANNRNPLRFAVFRESYESGFARIPKNLKIEIEYDSLPEAVGSILQFNGIKNNGRWPDYVPSLGMASEQCYWLNEINSDFVNRDPEKRNNLDPRQVVKLEMALKATRVFRPYLLPIRKCYDKLSLLHCKERAIAYLQNNVANPTPSLF